MRERFSSVAGPLTIAYLFVVAIFTKDIKAQSQATCVEWGEAQTPMQIGLNTRLLREHPENNCTQPELAPWRYDWNSVDLRRDVSDLNPTILRFPGGTVGNYWWWENETKQVIANNGEIQSLDICEGSNIGLSQSLYIGCPGPVNNFTAQKYNSYARKTTITLESYKDAVEHFRETGLNIQEMFMVSLLDPFYYLGSPQLEYEMTTGTYEEIIEILTDVSVERARVQLDKILDVYCDGCDSYDASFDIELGNEYFLQRYAKFFPTPECLEVDDLCSQGYPSVQVYSDICEIVIPMVRSRFPNAKIGLVGSRDLWGTPWNQVLIDRFDSGPVSADATILHFYPKTMDRDSLNISVCKGIPGSFDPDRIIHNQQKVVRDLFEQKRMDLFDDTNMEVWITEFNNYDFSEDCFLLDQDAFEEDDFVYDSGNWIHALSIFNLYNEFLGYRSEASDPWMNSSKGVDLTKLCMQVMYGSDRVAAIRQDKKLSAQGMAIETLMLLNNEATSVKRLLIGPSDNFQFNGVGDWSAKPGLTEPLPYHFELDHLDDEGSPSTTNTWGAYGFLFETPDGPKALVVNLTSNYLSMDISHVGSFEEGAHCVNRNVLANKLHETLDNEHASSQISTQDVEGSSSELLIPGYSVCILNGIPWVTTGLNDLEALSSDDLQIFPNPADSDVNIILNSTFNKVDYRLMDLSGQILMSKTAQGTTLDLSTSELAPGMYFIEVQAGVQRIMKPFIVQR